MATAAEKKEAKRLEALAVSLKDAGVELTGEETAEELDALAAEHLEDAPEAPKKGKKGEFKVSDSNGKVLPTTYETLEEAEEAAKVYGGKVQK